MCECMRLLGITHVCIEGFFNIHPAEPANPTSNDPATDILVPLLITFIVVKVTVVCKL